MFQSPFKMTKVLPFGLIGFLLVLCVASESHAATIVASRTSCQVPCGVLFKISDANDFNGEYEWWLGDGTTGKGPIESVVYLVPGTYTVELKEFSPSTGNLVETTNVTIQASSFVGQKYYVDKVNGNDSNSGTSPQNAWQNPWRFSALYATLSASARQNLALYLKRGQEWTLPNSLPSGGVWLSLSNGQNIIIGAYANADGSDNLSLPKPIIHDRLSSHCEGQLPSAMITANGSNDVRIMNIAFEGNYLFPADHKDAVCTWSNQYNMNFADFRYPTNSLFYGVDVRHTGGLYLIGVDGQVPQYSFLKNCNLNEIYGVLLFGGGRGLSVKDTKLQKSGTSHNTYSGISESVISGSEIDGSGIRLPENWAGCGLRLEATATPGNLNIYNNKIGKAAGAAICMGTNYPHQLPDKVIFDGNTIDGNVYPGQAHIPYWNLAEFGGRNMKIKNNIFDLTTRGPIVIRSVPGGALHDITFSNNTMVTTANSGTQPVIQIRSDVNPEPSSNITIRDNIFYHPQSTSPGPMIALENGVAAWAGWHINHNVYYQTNGTPQFQSPSTLSMSAWQALGFDTTSVVQDPLFQSSNPATYNFGIPSSTSPAVVNALNGFSPRRDHRGVFRKVNNKIHIGAEQYSSPIQLSISNTTPSLNEPLTFTVTASQNLAGQRISILASPSGPNPGIVLPAWKGTVTLPLNYAPEIFQAFNYFSGIVSNNGVFTAQVPLSQVFPNVPETLRFAAVVYGLDESKLTIFDVSNVMIVVPNFTDGPGSGASNVPEATKNNIKGKEVSRKK